MSRWHLNKENASYGTFHICFTFRTTCRKHSNWLRCKIMIGVCLKKSYIFWMLSVANQETQYDMHNRFGFMVAEDPQNWQREHKDSLVILCAILYTQRMLHCSSGNDQPLAVLRCLGQLHKGGLCLCLAVLMPSGSYNIVLWHYPL